MTVTQKIAIALAIPAALGVVWFAASAASPETNSAPNGSSAETAAVSETSKKPTVAARPTAEPGNRALEKRVRELEDQLAAQSAESTKASTPAPAPTEVPLRPAVSAKPREGEPGVKVAVPSALQDEITAGLMSAPGSPQHRAAVSRLNDFAVESCGPPIHDNELGWAAGVFVLQARFGRLSADEADDVATTMIRLGPGHGARHALAIGVAGGWAKDERLSGFLARFPSNSEAGVHQAFLVTLDHTPSPTFSEYLIRLAREERDPIVLMSVFNPDRAAAVTAPDAALRLAQAVEVRLRDGGFEPKLRSRAAGAIAVASLLAPDTGADTLRRLAAAETDAPLAQKCRDAAEALVAHTATAKSLEKLFK